jgi:hypothetical protein
VTHSSPTDMSLFSMCGVSARTSRPTGRPACWIRIDPAATRGAARKQALPRRSSSFAREDGENRLSLVVPLNG